MLPLTTTPFTAPAPEGLPPGLPIKHELPVPPPPAPHAPLSVNLGGGFHVSVPETQTQSPKHPEQT